MKSVFGLHLFLLLSIVVVAQPKPQKTYDHVAFAKKVYGNFSANMNTGFFLPDDKALEFISSSTGTSVAKLKEERDINKGYLQTDLGVLRTEKAGGLMVGKIELEEVAHPKLMMANIIIEVGAGPAMKRIVLGNCIQTNVTWVLGDYVCLYGKKPERQHIETMQETIAKYLAKSDKDYTQVKNKDWSVLEVIISTPDDPNDLLRGGAQLSKEGLYHFDVRLMDDGKSQGYLSKGYEAVQQWDTGYELANDKLTFLKGSRILTQFDVLSCSKDEMIVKADFENRHYYMIATATPEAVKPAVVAPVEKPKVKYSIEVPVPGGSAPPYVDKNFIDKPMRGYYIDLEGKKVDAVIKYQAPSSMFSAASTLLLYKIAYNETGFTEDESNNFITMKMKNEVSAFFVNGRLYVPLDKNLWGILVKEGAIRESVWISESKVNGQVATVESTRLHKRDGSFLDVMSMGLTFKSKMSEFIADNTALATKVKNKETGYRYLDYQKILKEYNDWFDTQYPGKMSYFYKE